MPLSFLAGLIPGRLAIAAGISLALAVAAYFAGRHHVGQAWEARWTAHQLAEQTAKAAAERERADTAARMQGEVDAARAELTETKETINAQTETIRRLLPDAVAVNRMRNNLAAARDRAAAGPPAAAGGGDGGAYAAACARSVELLAEGADLVAEGAGLVAKLAAERDAYAAEVVACDRAWPR